MPYSQLLQTPFKAAIDFIKKSGNNRERDIATSPKEQKLSIVASLTKKLKVDLTPILKKEEKKGPSHSQDGSQVG